MLLTLTIASGATSVSSIPEAKRRKFTSTRLLGSYEKPWLQDGSYKAREKMENGILLLCTCIGVAIAIMICGTQWKTVVVVDVRFLPKGCNGILTAVVLPHSRRQIHNIQRVRLEQRSQYRRLWIWLL
jgi:hypothetical protein